ncbi:hypothetical protein R9X49_11225 [Pectobacterium carotovorum]|uniref:hypothetical protein n=1 Tax=Pectobacterium carotovorum TaxID=554 RepID=UPI0029D51C3F|nr:hypothetical protein [Pectobacterium carotovorum]MDX6915678.1 hypothetical protein [Pectobacterium carotovorum]
MISRDKLEHILAYAKQQKEIGAMRCSALPDDLIEIVERLLAGNSQVIPDGYCIMPLKLTADNGAKGALSGEFHISRTVTCHECGGEGCEDCNDRGSWEEEILIGWDIIKLIYQSAVDACSKTDKASS